MFKTERRLDMPNIKISQLPSASQLVDNDIVQVIQSGTNKKMTMTQIKEYVGSSVGQDRFSEVTPVVENGVQRLKLTFDKPLTLQGDAVFNSQPFFRNGIAIRDKKITGVASPTEDTDAANKEYVDGTVATKQDKFANIVEGQGYVILSSTKGQMTVSANDDLTLQSGQYAISVNETDGIRVLTSGVGQAPIHNVADPTNDSDAATKKYVDDHSGGESLDVQINGESIVQDGVANIPYPAYSVAGVIKIRNSLGLGVGNDGAAYVEYSTNSDISNRSSNFKPITPRNLDYAVKAAMCDGVGAAWTDAEKYAARSRTGAKSNEKVLLGQFTATEVVSSHMFSGIPENNGFIVYIEVPAAESNGGVNFSGTFGNWYFSNLFTTSSLGKCLFVYENNCGVPMVYGYSAPNNGGASVDPWCIYGTPINDFKNASLVEVKARNNTGFPIGSKMTLWYIR